MIFVVWGTNAENRASRSGFGVGATIADCQCHTICPHGTWISLAVVRMCLGVVGSCCVDISACCDRCSVVSAYASSVGSSCFLQVQRWTPQQQPGQWQLVVVASKVPTR